MKIARKLGIPRDSMQRACAGFRHALLEASQDGHCALPGASLIAKAGQLLQIDVPVIEQALGQMLTKRRRGFRTDT